MQQIVCTKIVYRLFSVVYNVSSLPSAMSYEL